MADETNRTGPRQHRVLIEFELPDTFADDLPALLKEYGESFGSPGEMILNELGQMSLAALTFEFCGEESSSVQTVPVLAVDARIENVPPTEIGDESRDALRELAGEPEPCEYCAEGVHRACDSCGAKALGRRCVECGSFVCEIEAMERQQPETSQRIADRLSELDGMNRADRYTEAIRVGKIAEELGEAMQALIAYHNVNPRKASGPLGDVIKELCDVALTTKVALWSFGVDAEAVLAEREREVLDRLPVGRAAAADETSSGEAQHGIVPGSHERPEGPECRCGAAWSLFSDHCMEVLHVRRIAGPGEIATEEETCGRLLIGQGTDTWDPTCCRRAGHSGCCEPSEEDKAAVAMAAGRERANEEDQNHGA